MLCGATIFIVANDEEREFHCHDKLDHGLAHVFDIGNVPAKTSIVIVPGVINDSPVNPRDIIVKWSPV